MILDIALFGSGVGLVLLGACAGFIFGLVLSILRRLGMVG